MRVHNGSSSGELEIKESLTLSATLLELVEADKDGFSSVTFEEGWLAVARMNAKINVYTVADRKTFKLMLTILGHSNPVEAMRIHKQLLLTGENMEDALIRIWQLGTGTLVRALKGHTRAITCIAAHSHELIASASADRTVRVWQLFPAEELVTVLNHDFPVLAVSLIGEKILVSGGDDCFLVVWMWEDKHKLHTLLSHTNSLSFIVQENNEVITGGGDGHIKIYSTEDLLREERTPAVEPHLDLEVSTEALQHYGHCGDLLIISDIENNVFVVRVTDHTPTKVDIGIPYHERLKGVVLFSPELMLSVDANVKLWQLEPSAASSLHRTSNHLELILEQI